MDSLLGCFFLFAGRTLVASVFLNVGNIQLDRLVVSLLNDPQRWRTIADAETTPSRSGEVTTQEAQDLEVARKAIMLSARVDPGESRTWRGLWIVAALLGEAGEAEAMLARALNADPEDPLAVKFMAALVYQDSATYSANLSPVAASNVASVIEDRARDARRQGLLDEAVARYRAAIVIRALSKQRRAQLSVLLGTLLLYDRKEYRDSEGLFREAVELNPSYAEAYVRLGHNMMYQRRYHDALAALEGAIELQPSTLAYKLLGQTFETLGRDPDALYAFQASLRLDPNNSGSMTYIGRLLWRKGQHDEAREIWQRALEINPDYKAAKDELEKHTKED